MLISTLDQRPKVCAICIAVHNGSLCDTTFPHVQTCANRKLLVLVIRLFPFSKLTYLQVSM